MRLCETERHNLAADKVMLRKHLTELLAHVGGVLGDRQRAQDLIKLSKNVADYVRRVAKDMEERDGTENEVAVSILGMISDIALKRMTCFERKHLKFDTPASILNWFARYLENAMDKKDLSWKSAGATYE